MIALMLALVVLMLAIDLVSAPSIDRMFDEGYGVERASAIVFALSIPLWFRTRAAGALAGWHIPLALALMTMRELDLDKRLSEDGVLKLRTLTDPLLPWTTKAAAVLTIAVILLVLWRLARRDLPVWWRALRDGALWAQLLTFAIGLLVLAKSLDGVGRKLAPWGVELSAAINERTGRVEEVLELVFALLLVQVIALTRRA